MVLGVFLVCFFFFKQKTAYEMRISDWSSDVCSSDLREGQILRLIGCDGIHDVHGMVARMYVGIDPRLSLAAERSVLAHLIDLRDRGLVIEEGETWRMAA